MGIVKIKNIYFEKGGSLMSYCDNFLINQTHYHEITVSSWRISGEVAWSLCKQNEH